MPSNKTIFTFTDATSLSVNDYVPISQGPLTRKTTIADLLALMPAPPAVSDGSKGDITVSGSGAVWSITSGAVASTELGGDITSAGKNLLTAANAAAQRSLLGLGTLATQSGTFSGTSSGTNTGDQNTFSVVAVAGQSDVVADTSSDTLTLVAGSNITITTDAALDKITIAATGTSTTEFKGLTFTSDTDSTADSDPGIGIFKWNNATQASATTLYFDDQTADSVSLTTFWASLGASGFLHLQQADDATKWQLWKWTATPVDGTGYRKFTVTLQASGGAIADAKTCYALFLGAGGGGSTQGRHLIPVSAGSMTPSSTGGCGALTRYATSSGRPDVVGMPFDPTTEESAEFTIQMPKSWNEGTVTFDVGWAHGSTTTNFGTTWELKLLATGNDDTIDAAYGTAVTVSDTGGTTYDDYQSPESSAVTAAGSPSANDRVRGKISRKPTDGSDTMAVDAILQFVNIYITTDADTDA